MLNILRWDGLCINVNGYYWYYQPVGVTASGVGAAPVVNISSIHWFVIAANCGYDTVRRSPAWVLIFINRPMGCEAQLN